MSKFDAANPNSFRQDVVDDYFGTKVADPYRWLEDPDGEDTVKWVEAQNKVTESFLSGIECRNFLKEKLTEKYNYVKTGCSYKRGKGDLARYYFSKNDGLQNQYVLMRQKTLTDDPEVFFDPNLLSSDGTKSLGAHSFAESGKYWAYGVSASGSDWQTVYVKDIERGVTLEDKLEWVKFSGLSWLHDDSGFFYGRYPAPASLGDDDVSGDDVKRGKETSSSENMAVYLHLVGTPQSSDRLIFAAPEQPKWMFGAEVSDDGAYLLITVSESTSPVNRVFLCGIPDLLRRLREGEDAAPGGAAAAAVDKIIDNFEAGYNYITNEGPLFYFKTNRHAPRYRVVAIDAGRPAEEHWAEVVPHGDDVLVDAVCVGPRPRRLACVRMRHAQETLTLHALADGALLAPIPLPDVGTVGSLTGRPDDSEFFYTFTGFTHPGAQFRFDLGGMRSEVLRETVVAGHDPAEFETEQVFVESADGTKVPVFLVGRRGRERTGEACTLLYAYGGFAISLTPSFSPFRCVFIRHLDGLLAVANLRGGGEYGEEWHQAATGPRRQRSFEDFAAAAAYLVSAGHTRPGKLAIMGGSHGGMLVGASVNQNPGMCAAAIAQVGVMDMLRFHKFTIGHFWTAEYGCSEKSEDEFKVLHAYSPLHNIRVPATGQYPAVLVTIGDHDDRVVPLHSLKYAAQLQYTLAGRPEQTNPLLIRIETKAGHGAGKPTSKVIEETADIYSFIAATTKTPCIP